MVALVLSGGGNRGALQAGALEVLLASGIKPGLLVGTSVGAINAAFLAAGPTPERATKLVELWKGLSGKQVFPGSLPRKLWHLIRHDDHLYSSSGLRCLLEANLPYRRLEQSAVPLVVVAADLATGLERRLDAGPVIEAVLASAAIPGVFPPVPWGSDLLIDGGIAANVPLAAAAAFGATKVWALDTARPCDHPRAPRGAVDIALQAVALSTMARTQAEVACPPAGMEVHYLALSCAESQWFSDFRNTPTLIARGAEIAKSYLREMHTPAKGASPE